MIKLRTLGGLDLHDSQGRELRVIFAASKRAALLTYLAIATPRGFHRRDTLLALLWPELDQKHARGALRQALHRIRRSIADGALLAEGDEAIALDRDMVWCDAVAFEQLLDGGKEEEALALYRGALLEGFHLSGCLEFERWLEDERLRLKRRAAHAVRSLVEQAEAQGNLAKAVEWGRKATAIVPNDETALRRLITLLDREGNRAGAIREYEAFAKRLREDCEAEPAPETRALIEAVRVREQANGSVLPSAPLSIPLTKQPVEAQQASVTTQPRPSWRTRGRAAAAIVVLGAILAVGATVIRNGRADSPNLDPGLVLVRPFSNETGNPELETLGIMAADWISQGLAETGVVRVLATMTIDANSESDPAIAPAQSGSMRHAGTTVSGSFYSMGDSVSFQVQVIESASGEILASVGPVLASVRDPRGGVEELRQRTTGALASVVDPLLASWVSATRPPPSYEAYQLFAQGLDAYFGAVTSGEDRDAGMLTAADYFRRAADLDSTYALPLLWEVYAHMNRFDREGIDSTLDDLTGRRDALTRWEQNLLDALLADREGNDLRRYAALSRVVAMTPGSEWNYKLAQVAYDLGRYEEAATLLEGVTDQGWLTVWPDYWWLLTEVRHLAGQYERELQDLGSLSVRFPGIGARANFGISPLAALGRVEEALGLARNAQEFVVLVSELFAHGHHEAARSVIENHLPKVDLTTPYPSSNARLLFWTGRLTEAEDVLRPHLEEHPIRWRSWGLLVEVILAKGDREEAIRISNHVAELETRAPGIEANGRALTLMLLGDSAGAVKVLRPMFAQQRKPVDLLKNFHRSGQLPQSMADYAPFQELVGWPPPLPN
jgi:serine/threonine-protein kinase